MSTIYSLESILLVATSFRTIVLANLLFKKNSRNKIYSGEKIPSPKGAYPIFGHAPLIKEKVGIAITKWHKELGPIFKLKMGSHNWVLISDPEALHELLVKQGVFTSGRPELTFLSVVNSPNDSLSNVLSREIQRIVDMMREDAKNNQAIDIYRYSSLASISIILSTTFDIPCPSGLNDPLFKKIRYLVFDPIFKRKEKMIEFRDKEFHLFIREVLALARKSKSDSLVKKIDEVKEKYELDDQNSLSSATAWVMAILCHHPEVQKRAYREINDYIKKNGRQPNFSDRKELPYLCAIIKECLRFRLPLHLASPHLATNDVSYKNYIIPKGHIIYINMHTINNDPSLFPNPEVFDPDRFINDTRKRNNYGFGWGRRICPGIYMAESHMFHIISKLLATCSIEPEILPSGEKLYPDLEKTIDSGFTIGPTPYKVHLKEREDRAIV
ncbi:cytochrome P450 [Sporodiniella umbellata]|nr:cytochrome P450 [Sporodiniella umbellata]